MLYVDTSEAPDVIEVVCAGSPPAVAELTELRHQLLERGQLSPHTHVLLDTRRLTSVPGWEAMWMHVSNVRMAPVRPARLAFLVLPGVQFAVSHQVKALLPAMDAAVFTEEQQARWWVQRPAADSPQMRRCTD